VISVISIPRNWLADWFIGAVKIAHALPGFIEVIKGAHANENSHFPSPKRPTCLSSLTQISN
jgi:hypothetical protein